MLAAPGEAIRVSIAALARSAQLSEPTVKHFCHRPGLRGFPDFKLHLAQSLAQHSNRLSRVENESDPAENYSHKIFDSALAGLQQARHQLAPARIQQAVAALTGADKRAFFGPAPQRSSPMMRRIYSCALTCR